MTAVLVAIQVLVGGWVEAWPHSTRDFQHQMGFHAEARVGTGPLVAAGYVGLIWWGRHDTKIKASFFNTEAGKVLERQHGAALMLRQGACAAGVLVSRRAVVWLWEEERWGRPAEEQLEEGEPWPSLAYHDGFGAVGLCESSYASLYVRTGPLRRLNGPTLPWHEAWARAEWRAPDSTEVAITVEGGGPRPGTAWDIAVARPLGGAFWFEVHAGALNHPGFEHPVRRVAATVRIRNRPTWWP